VFELVASDATVSRLVDALAADAPAALAAIAAARATARERAWSLAGKSAPDYQRSASSPLVIDVDATLVGAHSEKESAAPTFKRGFGLHPLWAFLDHGAEGTGEPLAFVLRPGNAGSNTVVDHIAVLRAALAQLPRGHTRGKKVLVRVDGAGGTHELLAWLTRRRLSYSVGFSLPGDLASIQAKLATIPNDLWEPAYDARDVGRFPQLRGNLLQQLRGVVGQPEADRVRQPLGVHPGQERVAGAGAVGAHQHLQARSVSGAVPGQLCQCGAGDRDVVGGGVGAGVPRTQEQRQRLPRTGRPVVDERGQRVVSEASLECRGGVFLL